MKRLIFVGVIVIVLFGGFYGVSTLFTKTDNIPTLKVTKGEMLISVNLTGEIDAKQAYVLSTPRIRSLQITWLAPEGSMVEVGDAVIKFDATKQLADLTDNESSLKIARTNLERQNQEYTIQNKQLSLSLEQARRNYDEKKHDAPRIAEEAKMELELADLNFQAKLDQIKADVQKAELEVKRASDKVNQAKRELEQLTINAPIPGMVVYLEIWKGGTMSKVQEGDSPWPGQGLINLPDLSDMVVKATVSEVDAARVDSGQNAIVSLDAFPDITYQGQVYKKGTLARRKEPGSKINVFDVDVMINDIDDRLKPGMSASAKVIIERIPDIITIPLEAVFEKNGQTVVYLENRRKREVEVGRRNNMEIEIISGLDGRESICLIDPTLDEAGMPGDRATEPEMNKGRKKSKGDFKKSGGRKRGRGR